MNKKFVIKTLGCKTNAIEGQIIANQLVEIGFQEVDKYKDADVFILNSCSVTSHTDSQCAYLLHRAKRENPLIKCLLTGCVAQTIDLHKNFDTKDIDFILGNNEKLEIEKYINEICCNKQTKKIANIFDVKEFNYKLIKNPYQTRPAVKIQEGCNNRCSYCIIPYARGNSRSNSVENIVSQIEFLACNGTKEVVLTGTHIGQWGAEWGLNLMNLLQEIEKTNIFRYRLGSLYINELNNDMIEFLKKSTKFCPHFHLSLQSLCDKTLKNMNRHYSAKEAIQLVKTLYKTFDEPFLGCDIIAGFPDEQDKDFQISYANLKSLPLSYIHAFPYSSRENTAASKMKNQVQDSIKTRRTQMLNKLCEIKHKEFLNRNKNKNHEILFERKSLKTGIYSAISRNYIKVFVKSEKDDLRNTIKIVNMMEFDRLY